MTYNTLSSTKMDEKNEKYYSTKSNRGSRSADAMRLNILTREVPKLVVIVVVSNQLVAIFHQ